MDYLGAVSDDTLNRAILNGIGNSLVSELKKELMVVAEREVERVVNVVAKRIIANVEAGIDMYTKDRKIRLEVLFKKEQ
jgi:hypothetical protein